MNWRDLLAQNKQQNNDKSGWRFFFAVRSGYEEEKACACDCVCECVCVCVFARYANITTFLVTTNEFTLNDSNVKNKREGREGRESQEKQLKQKISRPVLVIIEKRFTFKKVFDLILFYACYYLHIYIHLLSPRRHRRSLQERENVFVFVSTNKGILPSERFFGTRPFTRIDA